jgi:hypothetical protein
MIAPPAIMRRVIVSPKRAQAMKAVAGTSIVRSSAPAIPPLRASPTMSSTGPRKPPMAVAKRSQRQSRARIGAAGARGPAAARRATPRTTSPIAAPA